MKVTFKYHNDESWSDDNFYELSVEFAVKSKIYKFVDDAHSDFCGLDYRPFQKAFQRTVKRFRKKIQAVRGPVKEYDRQVQKIIFKGIRNEIFDADDYGYELVETVKLKKKRK